MGLTVNIDELIEVAKARFDYRAEMVLGGRWFAVGCDVGKPAFYMDGKRVPQGVVRAALLMEERRTGQKARLLTTPTVHSLDMLAALARHHGEYTIVLAGRVFVAVSPAIGYDFFKVDGKRTPKTKLTELFKVCLRIEMSKQQ